MKRNEQRSNVPAVLTPENGGPVPSSKAGFFGNFRPKDASLYTGLSLSKLAKLRMKGQRHNGPDFIKLCGSVIYRKNDLDAWLQANLVEGE